MLRSGLLYLVTQNIHPMYFFFFSSFFFFSVDRKWLCCTSYVLCIQVAMDQVELEVMRVHGLTEKTDNKGSFWIKFDLGYSKDEKTGV